MFISVKMRVLLIDTLQKELHFFASVVILFFVLGRNAKVERIIRLLLVRPFFESRPLTSES